MSTQKEQALTNFKKANSLLLKIIEMVENDKYCIDIMQQNLAALGLLKSANHKLMEGHLNHCFVDAMSSKSKKKKQDMVDEILQVTKLSSR